MTSNLGYAKMEIVKKGRINKLNKKDMKYKYKITIQEITEKEVPETDYKQVGGKDSDGGERYGFVKTGEMKITRTDKDVYFQELENLDVEGLATYINGIKS